MFDVSPDIRADNARAALALPDLSADTRALLWGSLFHNVVAAVRPEEALGLLPKARDAVHASRDEVGWFALEVARSLLQYQLSYFEEAVQILAAAERRTVRNHEDARQRLAAEFMASELAALDRIDETFELADEGLASAQRDRQNWALRMFETLKGRQLLQTGRLAEAAAALEGRYSVADAHRVVGMLEAPNVVALGKLRIHTGDDRGADEVADMARIMLRASAPGVRSHAAWYLASYAMSHGKRVEAHNWLCADGRDNRLKLFPLFPFEIADDPQLVRIAVAVGDQELADLVIEQSERRCELNPNVVSFRAALAHARGLAEGSTTALEEAASLFGEGSRPLATASALEDLGRLLAENGVAGRATTALDQALEIWDQVGASRDATRVGGRLRRLGVHRRVVASKRPKTGWEALTSAEAAVAQLASEGKTNREIGESLFISPHTVNTHLRHIFDKLGVRSRVALTRVAEARRHQPPS